MYKNILTFLVLLCSSIMFLLFAPSPTFAQACQTPARPSNVRIEFPKCTGDTCDPTRAGCSWDAASDAVSYQVSITEVETGTVLLNNASITTTDTEFAVNNGSTYKCDVAAVNSCGTAGAIASTTLLCQTDGPTAVPTQAPLPTKPPPPPIAAPGSSFVVALVAGGVALLVFGGSLFFRLQ